MTAGQPESVLRRLIPDGAGVEIEAIRATRADLVEAYPDAGSIEFLRWLLVHGPLEYPDTVGRWFAAIPPRHLRHAGSGGPEAPWHLSSGLDDFELIAELALAFGERDLTSFDGVLDFGCGCGRVLRWFEALQPEGRRVGTEIRCASLDWCRSELSAEFVSTGLQPPMELPSQSVDLVYAVSVFSHLSAEMNVAWLRELARVVRPGGLMILSTLGAFALHAIARTPDLQQLEELDAAGARAFLRRLRPEGFIWHPLGPDAVGGPLEEAAAYDRAFVDPAFIGAAWSPHVDILGHIPACQERLQDLWVVTPRS